jgi:hypothetical protein
MKKIAPLILAAVLFGPTAYPAETRYEGAAYLFNLDEVSVVYPRASGAEGERNRRSAERRAAMLEKRHGVSARVVADDDFGEEVLSGNLLLLGWDNRLMSPALVPSQVIEGKSPRRFLDAIRVGNDEDLLFIAPSPYNSDRRLVFWSRIDPELDRFMPLPILGADWGVYRDYLPVAYGNFGQEREWPPGRDPYAESDLRGTLPSRPVLERTDRIVLRGRIDKAEVPAVVEARENALDRAIELVGDPGPDFVVEISVYPDADSKNEATGVADEAHAIPRKQQIHMTLRAAKSSSARQETLVVASRRIGSCVASVMCEGLGVEASLPMGPEGLPVYAAMIQRANALPTVAELLDEETFRSLMRRRLGMPAAGLLVRWIHEAGGREALEEAYRSPTLDPATLASMVGLPVALLDQTFGSWVAMIAKEGGAELDFQEAKGEAEGLAGQGVPDQAAGAYRRALEIRPGDPECLYKLAVALYEAGRPEESLEPLGRLIHSASPEGDPTWVLFAHYQRGLTYDALGRSSDAENEYRKVLELPDRFGAHEKALRALQEHETGTRTEEEDPGSTTESGDGS